ncbi:MAG: hypothetical protein A2V66_00680 [Ignavibacteria bacterium RBG_13_36_8]|nr:MAG: hypothetical protein A2V66_00680 [Ignavibacteria bacterium RBG_13_36_8]
MKFNRINYNSLAKSYNKRYTASPLEGIGKEIDKIANNLKPNRILEIGCGTGHWLKKISDSNSLLYGIDYSIGMLSQAKRYAKKSQMICADANNLPLKKNVFNFILCVNAIHHFTDPHKFIRSIKNIITHRGVVAIIGFDPRDPVTQWYLYEYFKGTYEFDLRRYPSFPDLENWLSGCGFENIELKITDNVNYELTNAAVLNDLFLRKEQASQLAALSDNYYQKGLDKIKEVIKTSKQTGKDIVFPVRLVFKSLSAILYKYVS